MYNLVNILNQYQGEKNNKKRTMKFLNILTGTESFRNEHLNP